MTLAVTVRVPATATSAPSGERMPSQLITFAPLGSYQWYVRFTGLAPVAFHGWLPVLVSVTATCSVFPAGADAGGAGTAYVAVNVAGCTVIESAALGANQATPSFTSAKRSVYEPGSCGAATVAATVRCAFGATSAPSGERRPSHTIAVAPLASYQ